MPHRTLHETSALDFFPEVRDLGSLREAARDCEGCILHTRGTQTVFGEGPANARLVLVGEQPGDAEDDIGRPFVGPSGHLLDRCLEDAGIDRAAVYVTNVVKHFKWEPRGRRRIHSKPSTREVRACRPWLDAELEQIRPELVVALGATAAQALLGTGFRLLEHRGGVYMSHAGWCVMPTVHPSALLRIEDPEVRRLERERFTRELRGAREQLAGHGAMQAG